MKNKYKSKKGISLLMVAGNYGGFHIQISSSAFHICIAFFALTIFFYDVENAMTMMLESEPAKKIDASEGKFAISDVSVLLAEFHNWYTGDKDGEEYAKDFLANKR